MKNKKILIIFVCLFILLLIGGYFAIKYVKSQNEETIVEEYVPEEEITEEQLRQTIVSLYFLDSQTNEIVPDGNLVDSGENAYGKTYYIYGWPGERNESAAVYLTFIDDAISEISVDGTL